MAKAAKYPAPKNETEAVRLLGELEKLKLDMDERQNKLNKAVHAVVTKANREAEPVAELFASKFNALKTYATNHQEELTDSNKRRSVKWVTGALGWRSKPAGISVPRSAKDIAVLIERVRAARKTKFLRRKWELNIEAMEASPEEATAIEGIKLRSASESFFVKFPNGDEIKQKIKLKTPSDTDLKEIG